MVPVKADENLIEEIHTLHEQKEDQNSEITERSKCSLIPYLPYIDTVQFLDHILLRRNQPGYTHTAYIQSDIRNIQGDTRYT